MRNVSQLTRWHRLLWVGSFVVLGLLAGMATPLFSKVADKIWPSLIPHELNATATGLLINVVWSLVGLGFPFCIATLLGTYSMLRVFRIGATFPSRKFGAFACALLLAYPVGVFLCEGSSSVFSANNMSIGYEMVSSRMSPPLFVRQLGNTIGFLFLLFAITSVVYLCARAVALATGRLPRHAFSVGIGVASLFLLLVPMAVVIHDAFHPTHYTALLAPPESFGLFELALWVLRPYVWWFTSAVLAGLVGHWFLAGLRRQGERAVEQD